MASYVKYIVEDRECLYLLAHLGAKLLKTPKF
jgi:hypothetical protein